MPNVQFSIITVVRNSVATIEHTICSVLEQTYFPIEYIIIDGASNDGTLEIIRNYEIKIGKSLFPNFRNSSSDNVSNPAFSVFRWISEPDKGIYDAINKGIEMANGKYIGILHSNDWFENTTCDIIAKEIEKDNSEIDLYYGMIRIYSIDGLHLKTWGSTMNLIRREMIAHPSCFFKKEVYKNQKYSLKYKSAADYDLLLRLNSLGVQSKFLEKVMANFKLGGVSNTYLGAIETINLLYKYGTYSLLEYLLRGIYIRLYYLFIKAIEKFK